MTIKYTYCAFLFSVTILKSNFSSLEKRIRLVEVVLDRLRKSQTVAAAKPTSTTPPPTIQKWLDEEDSDAWLSVDEPRPKSPRRPTTPPPPPPPPPPPAPSRSISQILGLHLPDTPKVLIAVVLGLTILSTLTLSIAISILIHSCNKQTNVQNQTNQSNNSNQGNENGKPMTVESVTVTSSTLPSVEYVNVKTIKPVDVQTEEQPPQLLPRAEALPKPDVPPKSEALVAELKTRFYNDRYGKPKPAGIGRGVALKTFSP